MSLDLFIHTPLINLKDRELCYFSPTTGIRALVIRIRIFLVCSVVTTLTDLPHQKRIFLKPFFFCQFSGEVSICRWFRFVDRGVLIHGGSLE